MMAPGAIWSNLGSVMATVMLVYTIYREFCPPQLRGCFGKYSNKLASLVYPYIQITFHEYTTGRFNRSEAYTTIETYLAANSSKLAKRLKADVGKESENVVLSMDDHEEVTDEFEGVKVWWSSNKKISRTNTISVYPGADEKKYYKLTFHKKHRDLITDSYLKHVLKEGKAIAIKNRQRKLYTNNPSQNWGWRGSKWSHVSFEHPATFETLALEPKLREDIIRDLNRFIQGKDYYNKVGKAWKRGYLLFGPPGTGKSTMIAAMANHLSYDVYDLELTAVKDNTELRKLLIETSSKSIIVIEDIDCSLDLAGKRNEKKKKKSEGEEEKDPIKKVKEEGENKESSKVTLSGLLNFIDGIWSASGGEKIIVFTTNFVKKLDPALIRRGRMDKHIELSYCCFEAFKVLARNYLDIESHELFERIEHLLKETKMTPADVAENLMPKSDTEDAEHCLKILIEALEEARKKAEEKARLKAEKEEKEKESSPDKVIKDDKKSSDEVKENGVVENGKGSSENGSAEK